MAHPRVLSQNRFNCHSFGDAQLENRTTRPVRSEYSQHLNYGHIVSTLTSHPLQQERTHVVASYCCREKEKVLLHSSLDRNHKTDKYHGARAVVIRFACRTPYTRLGISKRSWPTVESDLNPVFSFFRSWTFLLACCVGVSLIVLPYIVYFILGFHRLHLFALPCYFSQSLALPPLRFPFPHVSVFIVAVPTPFFPRATG